MTVCVTVTHHQPDGTIHEKSASVDTEESGLIDSHDQLAHIDATVTLLLQKLATAAARTP